MYANVFEKLNGIHTMCKIVLGHASSSAKSEVVGHYSDRTLEEFIMGIDALCKEARDVLIAEKTGMEA